MRTSKTKEYQNVSEAQHNVSEEEVQVSRAPHSARGAGGVAKVRNCFFLKKELISLENAIYFLKNISYLPH